MYTYMAEGCLKYYNVPLGLLCTLDSHMIEDWLTQLWSPLKLDLPS